MSAEEFWKMKPLYNQRIDPFYGTDNSVSKTETKTIPTSSPYYIKLEEVPKQDDPSSISIHDNTDSIDFTEVNTTPNDNEFRVNYQLGYIEFNNADAGHNITITYNATGTLIVANHINYLMSYISVLLGYNLPSPTYASLEYTSNTTLDLPTLNGLIFTGDFTINSGVVVDFTTNSIGNIPLVIISTGDVEINGTLDLSGVGYQAQKVNSNYNTTTSCLGGNGWSYGYNGKNGYKHLDTYTGIYTYHYLPDNPANSWWANSPWQGKSAYDGIEAYYGSSSYPYSSGAGGGGAGGNSQFLIGGAGGSGGDSRVSTPYSSDALCYYDSVNGWAVSRGGSGGINTVYGIYQKAYYNEMGTKHSWLDFLRYAVNGDSGAGGGTGAGSGTHSGTHYSGYYGGYGGNGGASVVIIALGDIKGSGIIKTDGEAGQDAPAGNCYHAPGGGGGGGGAGNIVLVAKSVASSLTKQATGGKGGDGGNGCITTGSAYGGSGGAGGTANNHGNAGNNGNSNGMGETAGGGGAGGGAGGLVLIRHGYDYTTTIY